MRARFWIICVVALWSVAVLRDGFDDWVRRTPLPVLAYETATEVRDRNGVLLRPYLVADGRWRLRTSLDGVDPTFIARLIAYEDKRFYTHHGVDWLAIARSAGQMARHGRIVSGGSTLTMQVARLADGGGTGRWVGKARQIRLALALERRLNKAQILDLYLHLAPYGGNLEGVRAATLAYLGKEPRRLTPAEAAFLIALPQAPEARRPDRNPKAAATARDRVLMRLSGSDALSADAARAALRDPVPGGRIAFPQLAPHLADRLIAGGRDYVQTTIDAGLQASIEQLAQAQMIGRDPRMSVAILAADHTTGEVLAAVGSPGYDEGQGRPGFVDMTRASRSPGSTLKPLVYGLAFDRGLAHPETLIADTPVQFGTYAPQNFDGVFRGDVRVVDALRLSLNIPVVRLLDAIGPAHLMAALRKTGADPQLPSGQAGLAIALGGVGLTLSDLVQSYAMLAEAGQARPLRWEADQAVLEPVSVLSARAAWQVGHMMAAVTPPRNAGPRGRVAYKTGTSYGHRDAWAIGFDGRYVVGVWMGRPDGTPVPGAFGGDLAAPVLFDVLARMRAEPVPLPPPPADTLMVPNARLPLPLQRFGGAARDLVAGVAVTFPPDGARVAQMPEGLPIKLKDGTPPYTVLVNGAVVSSGLRRPELLLPPVGRGFSTLSVIDARGTSARVHIEVR
ncbi:penicillin-binding protein 1C [Pseudoprimorskyibacter insulae]|uniref:peptidoglycan glycosyltransferase n=1 Tax=Pseudoprimorskyibacter insulae TaxID=1695997 RepID=A0A2R8AUD6_9RHOB|nr:penicillin-binding protein 1C [Pseudoprimorskyibacter insulae]SPF79661.1 Penicillin-binding protein 1C [Pseudoprimorskyibacter insulae]